MTTAAELITLGSAEVYRLRLLTEQESAAVATALFAMPAPLRAECWTSGDDGITTIGTPLYRTRDRPSLYTERAKATNAALYDYFRELHERVARQFELHCRIPVAFVDELAIPGFHLFEYSRAGRYGGGGWHFDQVARQVPYFVERWDEVEGILNFTLPLVVPSGGTGMELRDQVPEEPSPGPGGCFDIPYQAGVIVFNEHEYWHRIGPSTCRRDGERRLTLQGHGVRFRGRVLLFW